MSFDKDAWKAEIVARFRSDPFLGVCDERPALEARLAALATAYRAEAERVPAQARLVRPRNEHFALPPGQCVFDVEGDRLLAVATRSRWRAVNRVCVFAVRRRLMRRYKRSKASNGKASAASAETVRRREPHGCAYSEYGGAPGR